MQKKLFLTLTIVAALAALTVSAAAQKRYIGYFTGEQEVPATASAARGQCVVVLNAAENSISVSGNYSGLSSNAVAGHIHDAGPVGVNGPVRFTFTGITGTSGTIGTVAAPQTFAVTPAQVADLNAKRWYCNIHTANFSGGEIRAQVKSAGSTVYDADGDGRTDIAVFRTTDARFYTLRSVNNSFQASAAFGSGTTNDIVLGSTADDFDGDGLSDPYIVSLSGTNLFWQILRSTTNTPFFTSFGNFATANIERLAQADYDGDGRTDLATYRASTGVWNILESSTNTVRYEKWGVASSNTPDGPSIGDYDGDGKADLTVVRTIDNSFYWFTRSSRTGQTIVQQWGAIGDSFFFFAPIDVDADGRQDRTVSRIINGNRTYFSLRSSDNTAQAVTWGLSTDTQLLGDYDGDGKTDFVARRAVNGALVWNIFQTTGQPRYVTFGITGDQ